MDQKNQLASMTLQAGFNIYLALLCYMLQETPFPAGWRSTKYQNFVIVLHK